MGYRPITECPHCGDPNDVYMAPAERFCSEECRDAFAADHPERMKKILAEQARLDMAP